MRRIALLVLGALILCVGAVTALLAFNAEKGQVCLSKHSDNLVGCLIAPPVAVSFEVSGDVDEVTVMREDGLTMGKIVTNGRDALQTIDLSTAYKYYLVVRKGDQTRTGHPQGFVSNQLSDQMFVFSVDHWEGPLAR